MKRSILKNIAELTLTEKHLGLDYRLSKCNFICILLIFGSKAGVSESMERDFMLVRSHALQCSIRFRQVASGTERVGT